MDVASQQQGKLEGIWRMGFVAVNNGGERTLHCIPTLAFTLFDFLRTWCSWPQYVLVIDDLTNAHRASLTTEYALPASLVAAYRFVCTNGKIIAVITTNVAPKKRLYRQHHIPSSIVVASCDSLCRVDVHMLQR